MPSPTWHLDGASARLELPGLNATLDSARPECGLSSLTLPGAAGGACVLGVSGSVLESSARALADWHARGSDLVAAYEVTEPEAARVDLMWRAAAASAGEPWFARVDLLVSVRSDQLQWRHDLYAEDDLPPAQHAPAIQELAGLREALLYQGDAWSYAEFIRPVDFHHNGLSIDGGRGIHLRRHLFQPVSLEKGVILRARVRGLFFPTATACETVVRCYEEFLDAEPPLDG